MIEENVIAMNGDIQEQRRSSATLSDAGSIRESINIKTGKWDSVSLSSPRTSEVSNSGNQRGSIIDILRNTFLGSSPASSNRHSASASVNSLLAPKEDSSDQPQNDDDEKITTTSCCSCFGRRG